jgi:hypothetical protein
VEVGELLAGGGEGFEVGSQRDAGQLALEVIGELLAVAGMMEDAVDVVKDVPLGNSCVGVMPAKAI